MLVNLPKVSAGQDPVNIAVGLHLQINTIMFRKTSYSFQRKDATIRLLKKDVRKEAVGVGEGISESAAAAPR